MSEFVEVKTQDLTGAALDWATFCAQYKGIQPTINVIESTTKTMFEGAKPITFPRAVSLSYSGAYGVEIHWAPSADWSQGGPLIEKYAVTLTPFAISFGGSPSYWLVQPWDQHCLPVDGPTPLIAACRAIVASLLGDTVSVPKELLS